MEVKLEEAGELFNLGTKKETYWILASVDSLSFGHVLVGLE